MVRQHTAQERLRQAEDHGILVDEQDEWLLSAYTWHVTSAGYAATRIPGPRILVYLHHAIMGAPIWDGDEIDHVDRYPLNNRRSNLRYVTKAEQQQNRQVVDDARCIYKYDKDDNWYVLIRRDRQSYYKGGLPTEVDAAFARDTMIARIRLDQLSKRLEDAKPKGN
jgi:hypothetical protein